MDAGKYVTTAPRMDAGWKLKAHLKAIREYQLEVAEIILLLSQDIPDAEGAREVLSGLPEQAQIDLWSCSTKAGGMWERWQRDCLKYGEVTDAHRIWCERKGIPWSNV
jgi:hypothetical protein